MPASVIMSHPVASLVGQCQHSGAHMQWACTFSCVLTTENTLIVENVLAINSLMATIAL